MSEVIFREASIPSPEVISTLGPGPEPEKNIYGVNETTDVQEPVSDNNEAVLRSIGISDSSGIPEEDKEYLNEVSNYILGLIKDKGLSVTQRSFDRVIKDVMLDMDIDFEAEPSVILNRIGGMVKSWRDIAFIKDPKERRSLFMKLSRLPNSEDMNKLIMEEMEKRKIWR